MSKRAQITAFIIVGVVIIFLVILYVSLPKPNLVPKQDVSYSIAPQVDSYIEDIGRESLTHGIHIVSLKGGYIYSFDPRIITEAGPIAYNIKGDVLAPDGVFMESELERYVSDSLEKELSGELPFEGYNITFGEISSDVIIGKNKVTATIHVKTTINSDKTEQEFEYVLEVPIRLGHVLNIRDQIISSFKENPNQISNFAYEDVDVSILPFDDRTLVFSVLDPSSEYDNLPLIYNFAVDYSKNSAPRMAFVPDFVTDMDNPLSYTLYAQDYDSENLHYTVNSSLVVLDPYSGEFTFTPTDTGVFNFRFCVSDGISENCRLSKVIVNE